MESLQLFTLLLLAVSAVHLLFTAVATVESWLCKNKDADHRTAKGEAAAARSAGWYVFFDPEDLYGRLARPQERDAVKKGAEAAATRSSRQGRATVRPRPMA
ncbi:MAG: hypothetical protein ACK5PS_02830 [Desulfopila sp.]